MKLYVLDTNVLVSFQEGHPRICTKILTHPMDELAATVISVEEQLSGWYTLLRRSKNPQQLSQVYQRLADSVQLLARFRLLSFTEVAIARFEDLKTLKLGVKHMDLRIAAIALENGGTVVTANLADFRDIPGLDIEDWSK